jgi:hypothetical protein
MATPDQYYTWTTSPRNPNCRVGRNRPTGPTGCPVGCSYVRPAGATGRRVRIKRGAQCRVSPRSLGQRWRGSLEDLRRTTGTNVHNLARVEREYFDDRLKYRRYPTTYNEAIGRGDFSPSPAATGEEKRTEPAGVSVGRFAASVFQPQLQRGGGLAPINLPPSPAAGDLLNPDLLRGLTFSPSSPTSPTSPSEGESTALVEGYDNYYGSYGRGYSSPRRYGYDGGYANYGGGYSSPRGSYYR